MATIQPELFIFGNSIVEIVQRLEGPERGRSIANIKNDIESKNDGNKKTTYRIRYRL